mgnify:CR=1 FL=1
MESISTYTYNFFPVSCHHRCWLCVLFYEPKRHMEKVHHSLFLSFSVIPLLNEKNHSTFSFYFHCYNILSVPGDLMRVYVSLLYNFQQQAKQTQIEGGEEIKMKSQIRKRRCLRVAKYCRSHFTIRLIDLSLI